MKLYSIERADSRFYSYSFISLYNGVTGSLCSDKEEAIAQGEAQLEFKNIDTIYELIKHGFWIKCTEELKTI